MHASPGSEPPIDASAARAGRWLVVAVVLAVSGLITHSTYAGSGDAPHYLLIGLSIAFDGDLDVANNYQEAPPIIGEAGFAPETHARIVDGRTRPVHDIGLPLVASPLIAAAYMLADYLGDAVPPALLDRVGLNKALLFRHEISLLMALVAGFLAREMFLLFRAIGDGSRKPFLVALLLALAPPLLSHSFVFFTELPSALLVTMAFRRLVFAPPRGMRAAALGAAIGFLLLVHARNVGAVAGLVIVATLAVRRGTCSSRAYWTMAGGVAALVALRTAVTYLLWGTLVTTPHTRVGMFMPIGETAGEIFVRLSGLLVDREYGLLAYGPIYLLAAPGLVLLARARTPMSHALWLVLGGYVLPVLLPFVNGHGWTGGFSPAARMLVPVAPLLGVAIYSYIRRAPRWIVVPPVIVQMLISCYVWQHPRTLWNENDGVAALGALSWLPSWNVPGQTWAFALAMLLLVGIGYAGARRRVTEDAPTSPNTS